MSSRKASGLVAAFDCGTTSLKAVLATSEGEVLARTSDAYALSQPSADRAEQDPAEIWDALCRSARQLLAAADVPASRVGSMVTVASWKAVIPLTVAEGAIGPAIIWLDARASREATRINNTLGSAVYGSQDYWPRLMWLRDHQPELWRRADHVVGLNTYLKWRACNELVTEPSDDFVTSPDAALASSYGSVMTASGLDVDHTKFVECRPSEALAGRLTRAAAAETGLAAGTRVFNGFGDLPAVTAGAGRAARGDTHVYLGTSSWFAEMTGGSTETDVPLGFVLSRGRVAALRAVQTGCAAYDWALERFYSAEQDAVEDVHALVAREVERVAAGCEGLLATHWLNGELPPLSAHARGTFVNLGPHHRREHLVRALMESICFTHRGHLDAHRGKLNARPGVASPLRVVGGGARSETWMQMLADVMQTELEVPERPEDVGAMGAVYCALVGLGRLRDLDDASSLVPPGRRYVPNPHAAAAYDRMRHAHSRLFPALAELFADLNGGPGEEGSTTAGAAPRTPVSVGSGRSS